MLLLCTLSLAGCAAQSEMYPPGYGKAPQPPPGPPKPANGPVAILLPLTGPNAELANSMLNAARLALDTPGAPKLDVHDTAGTTAGAATAAQQAIAAGDVIILGPLTATETAAVAGPAQTAGVPVLAFTSDPGQARAGVWTLGLTPGQQVRRLVEAAKAHGRTRFAALLPDTEFGRIMAAAFDTAVAEAGAPPPSVRQYASDKAAIAQEAATLTAVSARQGPLAEKIRAGRESADAEARDQAAELAQQAIAPPPFDALLLAATGSRLGEVTGALSTDGIDSGKVQIMGPALWAQPGARGGGDLLNGAWYAAPDPAARTPFEAEYKTKYGVAPPSLADLAYDAAAIARIAAEQGGYSIGLFTRPSGFTGVDGLLVMLPDGHVRRSLALFEIRNGGTKVIEPPPSAGAPGA
jgi:branched-chain amino acid transport system substrate-binding protein